MASAAAIIIVGMEYFCVYLYRRESKSKQKTSFCGRECYGNYWFFFNITFVLFLLVILKIYMLIMDDENQFISILMLTPFNTQEKEIIKIIDEEKSFQFTHTHTCHASLREQLYFAYEELKSVIHMKMMMMIQFANAWKRCEFNIEKTLHMSKRCENSSKSSLQCCSSQSGFYVEQ